MSPKVEFVPASLAGAPGKPFQQSPEAPPALRFSIAGETLQSLLQDSSFREWVDQQVQQRLAQVQEGHLETARKELEATLTQQWNATFEAKIQEQGQQMGQLLNSVCEKVLLEKETLLQSHAKVWLQGIGQVLRKFLVYRGDVDLQALRAWLDESLKAFPEQRKVQVHVDPKTWETLRYSEGLHFQVFPDETLLPLQIRCDCNWGGAIFKVEEQLEKLDLFLKKSAV